ncbi:Present in the outer mitochondrial membrane proteome 17 [Trypanosoma cruzi]|uniref:Present in the outer mitochondrial membrane proteome 17 n=1 Tax=Trypanosoma cruzi TaxID=5693 RepID=A0A2V2UFI1_TRYCR|nr:Present in the outer mitochondrial membrane proteome 17 [Trypanosoma cruzi]
MDGQELTTENVTPVNVSSSPSPMDARTMHLQLQSPNAQIISPSFDVGDLISYEYFDTASGRMQCGLATVLEKLEENKLLVEPLMHEARRSLCGVVAITEEGNSILEELRNLEKEFLRCVKDAKQSSQEIWERRCAVQEKQEVEEAVIIAQEELGDVRTAVKKIDIHHWHELVSYRTPPEIVVRVMAAVVLVLGERRRTWAEIMPILHRPGITELLATFDSSDLTQAQREEVLQRYINTPKFTYEGVMKGSIALTELYRWVVAHVLMINVNEHRNQMSRINERCSSDPEELEQKLQEDFRKIARLNIEMNALWNRLYEVESKAASNFCASNNTTPRENQSARQRCSHKGLFERPLFAELIKMISGSWHYKIKPERP